MAARHIPATATVASRQHLLRTAQGLAIFTVAYNLAEGVMAIVAAVLAGSGALLGFGLDSGVESISGSILLWRLTVERQQPERADRVERVAASAIGISFLILAAYVAFDAITTLVNHDEPDASVIGIVLTATSLIVMPALATRKRRVAVALGSRAAEADSNQTWACVWLSAVVLIGLAVNATLGWWWADPVAALVVVGFLVREGRETLTANALDDCC